jgi:exodeoxyribonuclease V beta subunit
VPASAFKSPLHGVQLIEASAGTGKTWTLSALFARLIVEKGLDVEQILAITFTKAAAAELRDRIRGRLIDLAFYLDDQSPKPDDYSPDPFCLFMGGELASTQARKEAIESLSAAIINFDQATITTINGFCQGVLTEQALASGMPLESELVSDLTPIIHDIVHDYCRQQWRQAEPLLVHHFLNKDEFRVAELARFVTAILSQGQAHIKIDSFDGTISTAVIRKAQRLFTQAQTLWNQEQASIRELFSRHSGLLKDYQRYLESRFKKIDNAFATNILAILSSDVLKILAYFSRQTLDKARTKNSETAGIYFPHHAFFDVIQDLVDSATNCQLQLKQQAVAFKYGLVQHTKKTVLLRLYAQQAQSFDMQIKGLATALAQPDTGLILADTLRSRYPAALVDEFQDTDNYQYDILKHVYIQPAASACVLFLVGDPKQAIYRFRGADVYTYLNAYNDVAEANRHHLAENQRSVSPLIGALNQFFMLNADAFKQEKISYHPVTASQRPHAALVDSRETTEENYQPLRFWYWPIDKVNKEQGRTWAVTAIVNEVVYLLTGAAHGDVRLGDRALEGRDIVILVRSHSEADACRAALAKAGIKAAMQSHNKVFSSDEADDMARMLAAFAEPHNEGNIRAVLASRLCGATVKDFIHWQADANAWTTQLIRFQDYHKRWQQRGFMVAWRYFLQQEGAIARLANLPQGERIITNFLHLADLLHEEYRQRAGIRQLCEWFSQQRLQPQDSENAELRLESDENLVKIMTIHQSKGLEFPVVFLPSLWSSNGNQNTTPFYHQDEHSIFDLSTKLTPEIEQHVKDEALREDLRLGYVALTRAAQRCYVLWCPFDSKGQKVEQSALGHWLPHGVLSLQQLAQSAPTAIAVKAIDESTVTQFTPLSTDDTTLTVLTPPAVAWGYRLTSFSSLNQGTKTVHSSSDDELEIKNDEGKTLIISHETEDALARFNFAGKTVLAKNVGNCLHRIFEYADFVKPVSEWTSNINQQLTAYGILTSWQDDVIAWLTEVMQAPLTAQLKLNQLCREQTLRELDFHLPLTRFNPTTLSKCLHQHGVVVQELAYQTISGFMKGSIDLVFEHQGQYFIADYKSNHLGHQLSDYQAESLASAMAHHGYNLQAALYALALHRWLSNRLQDYDFEKHFGGAFYLFVRGMHEHGSEGVHFWRPTRALIDDLNALVGELQ